MMYSLHFKLFTLDNILLHICYNDQSLEFSESMVSSMDFGKYSADS